MALTEQTRVQARELMDRYPQARSALLPMLHLVQSEQGAVTAEGIALCAELLDLTTAEVAGVATFYTMYKRHQVGTYHVGVCTNTLCAVLGGDAIWQALTDKLGIGHDEVTADGTISLERIECQAACTHAPVLTANWEFLDDMDVPRALEVVAKLRAGEEVHSTRGPKIGTFTEIERALAGFEDGLAEAGGGADAKLRAGLDHAKATGMSAPPAPAKSPFDAPATPAGQD